MCLLCKQGANVRDYVHWICEQCKYVNEIVNITRMIYSNKDDHLGLTKWLYHFTLLYFQPKSYTLWTLQACYYNMLILGIDHSSRRLDWRWQRECLSQNSPPLSHERWPLLACSTPLIDFYQASYLRKRCSIALRLEDGIKTIPISNFQKKRKEKKTYPKLLSPRGSTMVPMVCPR